MAVHALEKGAAGAPCLASAPRKRGQVRKSFLRKGWHARFQFGEDRKKIAFHGPLRLLREEAEAVVNLLMPLLRENLRIRAQKLQSAFYKAFLMIQAPLALPHRHALLASFLCLRQSFCRK